MRSAVSVCWTSEIKQLEGTSTLWSLLLMLYITGEYSSFYLFLQESIPQNQHCITTNAEDEGLKGERRTEWVDTLRLYSWCHGTKEDLLIELTAGSGDVCGGGVGRRGGTRWRIEGSQREAEEDDSLEG